MARTLKRGFGLAGIVLMLYPAPPAVAIELVHANCSTYTLRQLPCMPPLEVRVSSPDSFATWADSSNINATYGCSSDSASNASTLAIQVTTVLPDSIYFREEAFIDALGYILPCVSRSDAALVLRVPAGQTFRYGMGGWQYVSEAGHNGAIARAWFALSRIESSGNTLIHSQSVQAGPGPPVWHDFGIAFFGTLTPGDYLYETHVVVQTPHYGGRTDAELVLGFFRYPKTTDVERASWSAIKSLYR